MSLVSVIVPALDEAPSLVSLYDRVDAVFRSLDHDFEFILIDDGSRDETPAVADRLRDQHDNVIVIRHYRNQGKSIALMQGFEAAKGDVAVTMDADLQDKPEMIPRLLAKMDEGYDLVNGQRVDRQDFNSRKSVSSIYNWLISRVFNIEVRDVNCGLKAMRREVYTTIDLQGDLHRLIPVLAALKAFKIVEVPVEHDSRKFGKSKYRLLRHRGVLDAISLRAINATENRPFHFFCEIAFGFWFVTLVSLGLWLVMTLMTWGEHSRIHVMGTLLGGLGTWAAFVGTILPLFGFFLEVEARRVQDATWRRRLVKEIQHSGKA